jgi:DNA-binding phage protein
MSKRIKVDDLPEFDAAPYLDSETAIAAYLTDILEANDPGLLAAALGVRLVAQPIRRTGS